MSGKNTNNNNSSATSPTSTTGGLEFAMVNGMPGFYVEVDGEGYFVGLREISQMSSISMEDVASYTGIPVEQLRAMQEAEAAPGSTTQEDPHEDEGFGTMDEEQDEKVDEEGEGKDEEGKMTMEGQTDE